MLYFSILFSVAFTNINTHTELFFIYLSVFNEIQTHTHTHIYNFSANLLLGDGQRVCVFQ